MSFGAIAVVAGAGAKIAGSIMEGRAKKKALRAQARAIDELEALDLQELRDLYEATDLDRYRRSYEAQRQMDPQLAALREEGARGLLQIIQEDQELAKTYAPALRSALEGLDVDEARRQRIADLLATRAEQELREGAMLPPEFQAELVRSGLAAAGQSGLPMEGRGATGVGIRRLLGSAGLALQQAREQQAVGRMAAAGQLRTARLGLLQQLLAQDAQLRQNWAHRAGGALAAGQAALPSIGMPGATAAQLAVANREFENLRRLSAGNVEAQRALASGKMFGSVLGGIGGFLTEFPFWRREGQGGKEGGFLSGFSNPMK